MCSDKALNPQVEPAQPAQIKIAIVVSGCWITYLTYLLTATVSPELGEWAGPPHLSSSVILALAISTVLSRNISSNSLLGWWTLITSTLLIIAFEFLQLLTPSRTFQFIDIAQGIAGAAIAAMLAVFIITIIGRSAYVWLALASVTSVLLASLLLLDVEAPEKDVTCIKPLKEQLSWDLVSINNFGVAQLDETLVSTSIGPLCIFDNAANQQVITLNETKPIPAADNRNLILHGNGLVSSNLAGLRHALSKSGEITFGIRFKADKLEAGRPPRWIAALQSADKPQSLVARLIQNGPNTTASFSFQPWQGSSTAMANRLEDQYHEIVLTYDGNVQTTYFDGSPVGTETTKIDAINASGSELILSIGKRVDRRWKPFVGKINAIVIGAKSVSADDIATVFQQQKP